MKRASSGKTMVELIVVMTILGVVLASSTTTLAALFQLERQFRKDGEQRQALARLATQLRGDAHQAQSCQPGEACILKMPDGRAIHYTPGPREVVREVRRGTAVEHRDTFRLASAAAIRLEQLDQPGGRLVRLTIRSSGPPVKGSPPASSATIDAAIGLARLEAMP
jgi:type II secretory pathway pseudopilin PulG